ncbi:hypothetical protein [Burkholderia ambifaria]|uniref:hypothetical protein n=1 Tax=Burkholderia ambifaria TaxID=152480 RepID=UPI001ABAD1F2|nr:hypothetical protein [Burkholderia ambifaria]
MVFSHAARTIGVISRRLNDTHAPGGDTMRPSRPPALAARFERRRETFARDPAPPLAIRLSRLDRLRALLRLLPRIA